MTTLYLLDTNVCSFIMPPIGDNDAAIAGNAISSGAILVANNVRAFERVPEFRFEDWVD